jgi:hypothetical protein
VNYAYAVVDACTGSLLAGATLAVREWRDDDETTAAKLVAIVRDLVGVWHPVCGAVEFQGMSQIGRGIQQATVAALLAFGVPTTVVYVQSVKTHFAALGLGSHGHDQNKLDAESAVLRLGYPALENHLADALLQALYVAATKNLLIA